MYKGDTACKECVFAKYEGNTQVACATGRLEKFRAAGVNVLECYDEEKEFYVIEDKVCNHFRPLVWQQQHSGKNLRQLVEEESYLKLDILIYVDRFSIPDQTISKILKECQKQTHRVNSVFLVLNRITSSSNRYIQLMVKYNGKFKWKIERVVDTEADQGDAINYAVNHCTGQYYLVVHADNPISIQKDLVEKLHQWVNEDMKSLAMVLPTEPNWSGLIVSRKVHNDYGGNSATIMQNKIAILAAEQKTPQLVQTYKEIF